MKEKRFLGRIYDEKTMTWIYPDGSGGALPEECRQEMLCKMEDRSKGQGIRVLAVLWAWKERLGITK